MPRVSRFASETLVLLVRAYRTHGPFKGTLLGVWRILRCHPFGAHGYDPVPPRGRWRNDAG